MGERIVNKNESPTTPPAEPDKVGYGNPPKHTQFKKGQSGNPKGRPKALKAHMPVSRIIRHSLSEEVHGQVNGKTRKMTKLEAIIEVQSAKALKGDTRAAKLVIDLGHTHSASSNPRRVEGRSPALHIHGRGGRQF